MSGEKIEAVLFDYGGVFTASPFEAVEEVGREMGARPGQAMEIIFGPYDRDTDHPWHKLERGELSLEETRQAILLLGKDHGLETDIFHFLAAMGSGTGIREAFVQLVRDLRAAGFKTGIVTNNVVEFREHWKRTMPMEELFDSVVDSSEVGLRKPDPAIYRHALDDIGVPAERTLFLDDFEGNIEAARSTGMHAILVGGDFHRAIDEVRDFLA